MWSLTSPRIKLIGGFRKFRSHPSKDFFDSIDQEQTSGAPAPTSALPLKADIDRWNCSIGGFDPKIKE
jgi:hypothetical protein